MLINIDKSLVVDKFDLLVYCYCKFKSLDEEKGYYNFNTDSLLEDMNIKSNERNWKNIDDAIENLDRKGKIFPYYYDNDDSYAMSPDRYETDILYFKLYKHEFDLLIDETKSLIENSKLLHYYCWLLSCLDVKTQTFPISNSFIQEGYGVTDKTVKKNNDKLVGLELISVSTEYRDGMNTSNFYKRLYFEETKLDEPAAMDEPDEKTKLKIQTIMHEVKFFLGLTLDVSYDLEITKCIQIEITGNNKWKSIRYSDLYSADEFLVEIINCDFHTYYEWVKPLDKISNISLKIKDIMKKIECGIDEARRNKKPWKSGNIKIIDGKIYRSEELEEDGFVHHLYVCINSEMKQLFRGIVDKATSMKEDKKKKIYSDSDEILDYLIMHWRD